MAYHFTGCGPFVDSAADSLGLNDARHRSLARAMEPVKRVQTAIGRAADARPDHQVEIFAEALKWRSIVAVVLAGIDAAIADAKAGLNLADEATPHPVNLLEGASPQPESHSKRRR